MFQGRKDMRNLFVLSVGVIVCLGCSGVLVETSTPTMGPTSAPTTSGTATSAASAKVGETAKIEIPGTNVTIEMVSIPGGSFEMGSPADEEGRHDVEGPVHTVKLSPFWMGKYEVTQAEWKAVMGSRSNSSYFKGDDLPVEMVGWYECQEFIRKMNEKVPGGGFRLPSEAEWEYACRAGSRSRYCFGNSDSGLGEYAWSTSNSGNQTHPVGQKRANAWGLYDMHGNVSEWCQDWYHDSYTGAPSDGSAWESPSGSVRVLRGGSLFLDPWYCRSSNRFGSMPDFTLNDFGFRLARTP
jgi:formylglycine-generating enzyme required for sulfatase activity